MCAYVQMDLVNTGWSLNTLMVVTNPRSRRPYFCIPDGAVLSSRFMCGVRKLLGRNLCCGGNVNSITTNLGCYIRVHTPAAVTTVATLA